MRTLYTARNSICTQKVFMTMVEKTLAYDMKVINLFKNEQYDPEYLKLNPKGVVPTLVDDGNVVPESTLICEYVDETYSEPALLPDTPYGRARARIWSKQVDETIFEATREISFSAQFREKMKTMTEEQRQGRFRNVGDPDRRARFMSTYEHGVDSPYVYQAIANFEKMFKQLEATLDENGGPWILGDAYTLADINLTPYIWRMEYLTLLDTWTRDRPNTQAWWERAKERASAQEAIPNRLSADEIASMGRFGGAIRDTVAAKREKYLALIA